LQLFLSEIALANRQKSDLIAVFVKK
ncbi:hypothetical protein LCGC14_2598510, partial [marine sediment metagenome]